MTLKSLNTRYVNLIRKITMMGAGLLLAIVSLLSLTHRCAEASGFNRRSGQTDNPVLAPLFVNKQQLTASDGTTNDLFGHSVAFSGSTIVVGAQHDDIGGNIDQGSVYVFNRQGGSWVEAQKLTASDGMEDDLFGRSVAVSGSTIVVGAWRHDIDGNSNQGAAYIFNLQGGKWVEAQKLTTSNPAADSAFGWSVAVSGSTIVIGAIGDNGFQGAAFVFNRQGGSWVEAQKLTASDGTAHDDFGESVAVSGSTIVIGAIGDNDLQGSAYIFNRQGGNWIEEQKLTASDGGPFGEFGWSSAINGTTVVVGAPGDNVSQGAAYVFNRQGGSWVEEQKLTASDGGRGEEFAFSIGISGSTIVIGAPGDNDGQGAAYVFNRQAGRWIEAQKLTTTDGGFLFGSSVAVSGSTVVVGKEAGGNIIQGSAYIFEP